MPKTPKHSNVGLTVALLGVGLGMLVISYARRQKKLESRPPADPKSSDLNFGPKHSLPVMANECFDQTEVGQFFTHVSLGQIPKVREALARQKTLVHQVTDEGLTPLHYAADRGHLEIIQLLVMNGANVNALDEDGLAPADHARISNHEAALHELVLHGADLTPDFKERGHFVCE